MIAWPLASFSLLAKAPPWTAHYLKARILVENNALIHHQKHRVHLRKDLLAGKYRRAWRKVEAIPAVCL